VLAAVEDVQHGHGQRASREPSKIPVKRHVVVVCRSVGHCQRHAQYGVRTKLTLVRCAVQQDQLPVQRHLVAGVRANDLFSYINVYVLNGLEHPFAAIAGLIAVS
jgi:hypothetical protein